MRISDWSSYVSSSYLCPVQPQSRPIAISRYRCAFAIGAEEVSAVDLVRDVGQFFGDAVGDDDIGLALERGEIAHDARVEPPILFEQRFLDDDQLGSA